MDKNRPDEYEEDYIQQRFEERFNDLRRFDKYSDCAFKVQGHILNGHKLILAASSPVFDAMFYGPLAETQAIRIDDISLPTFSALLDFIYSGKLGSEVSIQRLLELFYCAQKYLIEGLGKQVLKALQDLTRKNNVLMIYKMAYEMSLEDITYSCIYAIKHWLDNNYTFANQILQKNNTQITAKMLGLLINEVFSFKDYNSVLCMVRAWCLDECSRQNLDPTKNNFAALLDDCDLSKAMRDVFLYQDYALAKPAKKVVILQRLYHKAARPLIVGEENEAKTVFWPDQFTAVTGFSINSRLFSCQQTFDLNSTYTEEVFLELWANDDQLIHSKRHIVHSVEYNESVQINLLTPVVIFPGVTYTVKVKWDRDLEGFEYPRSVFSNHAAQKGMRINFRAESGVYLQGSVLNGIICEA